MLCIAGDQRHSQLAFGAESQERAVRGIDQVGVRNRREAGQRWRKEEDGHVIVATVLVRGIVRGELVVHRACHHHYRDQANRTIIRLIMFRYHVFFNNISRR